MLRSIKPRHKSKVKEFAKAAKVTLPLSAETIAQLDVIAARRGITRDEAARDLLCRALHAMSLAANRR